VLARRYEKRIQFQNMTVSAAKMEKSAMADDLERAQVSGAGSDTLYGFGDHA
jgi:hypothetical protein